MSVAQLSTEDDNQESKKAKKEASPVLGLSNEDKIGTIQPHDDTLVVTLRIGGYDVKRVLVDQDSAMEIMYPDLYKGLNLKPKDLTTYDSPLVSFEERSLHREVRLNCPYKSVRTWWRWILLWLTLIHSTQLLWPDLGFTP